jgi:predicted nuclease with TOPRIM domain
MLRKKSSAVVPIETYRQLAHRLEEAESLIDTLTLGNEQLQEQNHILREELRKLTLKFSNRQQMREPVTTLPVTKLRSSTGRSSRPKVEENWELDETIDEDEPRSPGFGFWLFTLLVAAAAGLTTFYLVRPLLGTHF